MKPSSPREQRSGSTARPPERDVVWIIVVWGRVVVGLALATVGGVTFGHAWTREYAPLWWVGVISLLTGVLLVLSGLYARSRPPGVTPEVRLRGEPLQEQEHEPLVPLLGAILVYKYRWITQQQLNRALEQQRKERQGRRLLGEILVEMGALDQLQLAEALAHQRSVLRAKKMARAGEARLSPP